MLNIAHALNFFVALIFYEYCGCNSKYSLELFIDLVLKAKKNIPKNFVLQILSWLYTIVGLCHSL